MNDWLLHGVAHGNLVEDIRIQASEICDYQVVIKKVFDDLVSDQALLVNLICSDDVESVAQDLSNQVT